jgi:hypothetical protein
MARRGLRTGGEAMGEAMGGEAMGGEAMGEAAFFGPRRPGHHARDDDPSSTDTTRASA